MKLPKKQNERKFRKGFFKHTCFFLAQFYLLCIFVLMVADNSMAATYSISADTITENQSSGWKNWYGIAWWDTPANQIKYAKQMGYDYIAIRKSYSEINYYLNNYKNNPAANGLKFYLLDPFAYYYVRENHRDYIDKGAVYSQADQDFYNNNMAWKSNDPFPDNLGTGWWQNATRFNVTYDFQQQAVIDKVVERTINFAKELQNQSSSFTFAGYMFDVSIFSSTLNIWDGTKNVATSISYWTGNNSALLHAGIAHEYATYKEGRIAFFKKLRARIKEEFPNAKWIVEPWRLYSNMPNTEEMVYQLKDRQDKDELTPDMLMQEFSSTEFVDTAWNFNSGVNITKDRVGITQPNEVGEYQNRLYAAKAAINGAWYNWFGRWGGTGNMPGFTTITDVYPRLKLIRCIPNWDNLNEVPLEARSWTGTIYQSPKSYISADLMYSRHPKTGKIFVVFNTKNGVIKLNPDEEIISIQRVDDYFVEKEDGMADVEIDADQIRLKDSVVIETDATNNQIKGIGYIITVAPIILQDTQPPTTPTNLSGTSSSNTAINLTWTASTDNIAVSGYKIYRNGIQIGTSQTTSYSDTGLAINTSYTYAISAYDDAGNNSTLSSSVIITTLNIDTVSPTAPADLSVSSKMFHVINLTWSASTDNVGVAGYRVYRNNIFKATTSALGYADTGLKPKTSYTYFIIAYDTAENLSTTSTLTTTTSTPLPPPITPDKTSPSTPTGLYSSSVTYEGATITWSASSDNIAVAGYQIYRDNIFKATTSAVSYADTGLSSQTSYSYIVIAYDEANNKSASSTAYIITTVTKPATPPSNKSGGGGGGGGIPIIVVPYAPVKTQTPIPQSQQPSIPQISEFLRKARLLKEEKITQILAESKQIKDAKKEENTKTKYLPSLKKGLANINSKIENALNIFLAYGVDENTKILGSGERAAVLESYKAAFKKMPETETELADIIRVANGSFPTIINEETERIAKEDFMVIYKKIADMNNVRDRNAIKVMAYGVRQIARNRNLNSEKAAISIFKTIFKKVPQTTREWNKLQTIAYSGAVREIDTDKDFLPDAREKELGTDPKNPDTDKDGFFDGIEVNNGYNPKKKGKL